MKGERTVGKRLFVFLAIAVLALPAVLMPFRVDIRSYRADAITSPADSLALRNAAITGRSRLLALIGETGSRQVVAGKDGFLFFADTLDDFQHGSLTDAEIAALTEKLLALQRVLAQEGRRLVVLVAPNKNAVYPEMMPPHILPSEKDGLARVNTALASAGLNVLDAQAVLLAGKQEGLLYFKGDSHWNARGARLVYQELMRLTETAAPDYADAALLEGRAGDLTLLCQPGTAPVEPDAEPDIQRAYRTQRPMRSLNDARIQTSSGTTELTMLVVRDSFGEGLFPYLANTAGKLVFSRSDKDVAQQAGDAQADWVVVEVVQRNLRDWLLDGALVPS